MKIKNQDLLLKVNDLSNSPQGFKDNYATTENDFSYDYNGNMGNVSDLVMILFSTSNTLKINVKL